MGKNNQTQAKIVQKGQKLNRQEKVRREKISIKVKLIVSHILIAVVPILIIVLALTSLASTSILKKVNDSNLAYVTKVTKIFDGNVKSIEDITRIIVADADLNRTIGKNKDDYDNAFEAMTDRKTNFENKVSALVFSNTMIKNIFLIKESEIIGTSDMKGETFPAEFFKSDIYTKGLATNMKPMWFYNLYETDDLYLMRNLKSITTGKDIGVLVVQVKKELFNGDLKSDFGDQAKLALIDAEGKIVTTPEDQEDIGSIAYFSEIKTQLGLLVKDVPMVGTFTTKQGVPVETSVLFGRSTNGWIYVMQIPVSEFLGDIQKIKLIAVVMTAVVIVLAILIGVWMALSISKPIDYIRRKIKLVEGGDLTVESSYVGKYEIGQLSQSFNHMTKNMKNLLQEVNKVVERVSTNSDELNKIAKTSALASKEVMEAVESVTSGATEQARDAEKTTVVITELVAQFNATEEHFAFVVKATDKTKAASESAKSTLEMLSVTTGDTVELSKNIQMDIKNLVGRFDEISSIIGMINGISEQTNLLALNAAIEAARAGESGRGFAVVADEVRKLAVQSSGAVKSISDIINSIYADTTKTEKMIQDGSLIYIKQEKAVGNTEAIFKEIVSNMDVITKEVQEVYDLLEGLDEVQVQATDSITSIASIAQESAAAIEEVLASGEEQLASAEQLVNMSLELSEVIKVMGDQISLFNIEEK